MSSGRKPTLWLPLTNQQKHQLLSAQRLVLEQHKGSTEEKDLLYRNKVRFDKLRLELCEFPNFGADRGTRQIFRSAFRQMEANATWRAGDLAINFSEPGSEELRIIHYKGGLSVPMRGVNQVLDEHLSKMNADLNYYIPSSPYYTEFYAHVVLFDGVTSHGKFPFQSKLRLMTVNCKLDAMASPKMMLQHDVVRTQEDFCEILLPQLSARGVEGDLLPDLMDH